MATIGPHKSDVPCGTGNDDPEHARAFNLIMHAGATWICPLGLWYGARCR